MIPLPTIPFVEYPGPSGMLGPFSITFPTFEAANVEVSVIDTLEVETALVIDIDYTLDDIGIPNTYASLTLIDAAQAWIVAAELAAGYTLKIKFTTQASQPAKFRDLGRFAPEAFEKTIDRLTMNLLAIRQAQSEGEVDQNAAILALQLAVVALQGVDVTQDSRLDDLEADVQLLAVGSIANALIFG